MAVATRLIHTTPDAAFTYLSDLTRHNEWAINPGLTLVQTSPGAVMPGATFRSRGTQFGMHFEDEIKVTAFEPPLRFAFEATGSRTRFRHVFEFEPAPGGTQVSKEMRLLDGPKLMLMTSRLTDFVLKRRMAKDLRRIAARLESGV